MKILHILLLLSFYLLLVACNNNEENQLVVNSVAPEETEGEKPKSNGDINVKKEDIENPIQRVLPVPTEKISISTNLRTSKKELVNGEEITYKPVCGPYANKEVKLCFYLPEKYDIKTKLSDGFEYYILDDEITLTYYWEHFSLEERKSQFARLLIEYPEEYYVDNQFSSINEYIQSRKNNNFTSIRFYIKELELMVKLQYTNKHKSIINEFVPTIKEIVKAE
ncbi:hypothetical protein ACFSCX_20200 [Bacillus salitolerans]|uniref:Lipoprotein n=1 Tax=Bacillus salitolerans TaxID=1437434 RepID=A0ABW4LUU5_9BACI